MAITTHPWDAIAKITPEQETAIYSLIKILGENSCFTVGFHTVTLLSIQGKISNVNPLVFLSVILLDETSKKFFKAIFDSSQWKGLQRSTLSSSFTSQMNSSNLSSSFKMFSQIIKKDYATLEPFYQKRSWPEFLEYLAKNT